MLTQVSVYNTSASDAAFFGSLIISIEPFPFSLAFLSTLLSGSYPLGVAMERLIPSIEAAPMKELTILFPSPTYANLILFSFLPCSTIVKRSETI